MPRQPLADTPGLPPYGQRSSERRKEQNRLAQRQLRERRQQQEAAQAFKLQQQQNEIRRLNRLITELRNENFNLKNQSAFRRRQSVIPISSLSRSLIMNHGPTSISGETAANSSSKSLFSRHSIDYSSLHGARISTSSDASHRLHEKAVLQDSYSEDEHGMSYASDFHEPTARSSILQPTRLSCDHLFSRRNLASQACTSQDRSGKVNWGNEKVTSNKSYGAEFEGSSPIASSVSSRQPFANSIWLSTSRNTTPIAAEVSEKPWGTSAQKLEMSPRRDSTSKAEGGFLTLPSVNLASFGPARPPSPNKTGNCAAVDRFSDSPCNLSVVPTEFFPTPNTLFSNNRIQPRKTSASAESDTSSNTTTSILPPSESYSPLSALNANYVHFSYASQEGISSYDRSLSPTATGNIPEVKIEEKNFSEINSTICFRSPFVESNKLDMNETSSFSLPLSLNETKKFNVETLSPFPTHANSMCAMDLNDIWALDY